MRNIAISDIHGCLRTFKRLVEDQVGLTHSDTLYLLGDYVDRGPDSKGVLDYIMQLSEDGYRVNCLKGNHEEMMVQATTDSTETGNWLYNGGQEALDSFHASDPTGIPKKYIQFANSLDYFVEVDGYVLVHAGLNFVGNGHEDDSGQFLWKIHNPLSDRKAMLWIRNWYDNIDWGWMKDRVIIHGHTPMSTHEIMDMHEHLDTDQVLDIDNGCFAKHREG